MTPKSIIHYLQVDMWRQSYADTDSTWKKVWISTLRVLDLCVRGYLDKGINNTASALTYALVFAAVPILAIMLAVSQGFGMQDVLEDYLNTTFLREYNIVPTIMEMVHRYLETAQGGVFLGVGLLILLWAVYSFFSNVEKSFNEIWNVGKTRSLLRQVVAYLAILFLMPILMVVSSGLFSMLASLMGEGCWAHLFGHLEAILPYATAWVLFTAMYKAVPNTKVSMTAAVIPGVLMGTLFQILQWALVHFVVILARTSVVYGAFALIPIFLMCVQWMCVMILVGAQMSFAIQNNEHFSYAREIDSISKSYNRFLELQIVRLAVERFCAGESAMSAQDFARETGIPARLVLLSLTRLTAAKILIKVGDDDNEDKAYQPAMNTDLLTVGLVEDRLDHMGRENFLLQLPEPMKARWQAYCELKRNNPCSFELSVRSV